MFPVFLTCLGIFLIIRTNIVARIRLKRISKWNWDRNGSLDSWIGGSLEKFIFMFHKWTYKQFYPEPLE